MLPFVARATIEVLALVPNSLREASLGLGIPQWRTTLSIVVPRAAGGIVTGTVLAVARVAGETAPLLFTSSLVGTQTNWNPFHALQSIPVAIFELSESPDPKDHARAWAAGFILLVFILLASLAARWLATHNRRKLARR
jgi:phosphate transport system permease protein